MKHKILGIAVLLCAVFLAACSDLVDELTPKETYYKIEISSEIENGKVSADKTSARAGDTVKLTLTANEGYRFSELTVTGANNAAVPVTAIKTGEVYTFTMPASAVKISAAFIPISTYKVTFSTDGGTEAAEQTVEENGRAERPSDPAKDGFTFAGWYTSADGGATLSAAAFDFNTPITADITLYAKWIDATVPVYKVTIADGTENGTVSASADTAAEGTIITLTAKPTSGYTLSAYSVKDAEGNPVSVTTDGTFTMPASNVTVYATFTELPPDAANYTVKHLFQKVDASGYEQNTSDYPDETKTGTVGGETAASAKTVTGFTAIFSQETIEADGSTVVEIKYDRVSNTVTYEDGADGDIAVPEGTFYRYGQTVTVSFTGIGARPGYLFTGWKQGDATYTSDGTKSFIMGDSPVTLTAQWTKIGTTFAVTISESTGDFSLESAADGTKLTFTAVGTDSGANLVWKVYKGNTALTDAAYTQSSTDASFSFDTSSLEAGSYTLFVTSGTRSAAAVFTVPEPIATLKTGSEINAILNTFGKTTITQFAKSGTNNEGATEYLDIDKKIPVWLNGTAVYYYVPDGIAVYMNEDSSAMFGGCQNLTGIDIAGFDTSKVTDMSGMFDTCLKLETLNITDFDTSSVTNMSSMFCKCITLASLNLSSFDTSSVTNMSQMFEYCKALTSLDLSGFDTSNVTNMSEMLLGCEKLKSLTLSNRFNTSMVETMASMFHFCEALESLDLSSFNTSNVTNMSSMFNYCSKLESIDVSRFDTSNVTKMSSMFSSCSRLESLDLRNFTTSSVTDMLNMFNGCRGLESLDVSEFDTSKVENMGRMFNGCSKLTSLDVRGFDTSNVTSMSAMFSGCSALESLDLKNFATSRVTDMSYMFTACSKLTSLDVSKFDTSKVENMSGMFSGCSVLESLDVSKFATSSVTNMDSMFNNCEALTSLDVRNFDTSSVTAMGSMFSVCTALTSLDLSSFNTSKVTDMSFMFNNSPNLKTIYVTDKFVTSAETNGYLCFAGCNKLVGGAGTTCPAGNEDDIVYARIDGGNSDPGYFTLKLIGSKSKPDAVGDIVFSDGSATAYTSGLTLTNEQKSKAVAVIFYAGSASDTLGAKTLGVGLKNTAGTDTLAWAKAGVNGFSTDITAIQCTPADGEKEAATAKFTGDLDGSDNWQALCNAVNDGGTSGNYPAWEWVNAYATTANLMGGNYASGWYLPTVAELSMLYRAKDTVNAALEKAGGTEIADAIYWSSSQIASGKYGAWNVRFVDGYLDADHAKNFNGSVCTVRAF